MVSTGLWILVATLAVALVVSLLIVRRDGRFRSPSPSPSPALAPDGAEPGPLDPDNGRPRLTSGDVGAEELGARATLVHFSSAFCAPCRATRQVLKQVSADVPGVTHVEVDAESHLDLVRRLDVRRTPTVLVLDADGWIRARASGPPRKAEVLTTLGALVSRDDVP